MAEQVRVKVEQVKDGEIKASTEYTVDAADTGGATPDYNWIPFHLEVETRVEAVWYKFLPDISEHSSLTGYKSFQESEGAWVWFEIGNMLAEARIKLLRARGYKEVEGAYTAGAGQAGNRLRIAHLRKMDEFHGALKAIKKLEDLILRLIFEGAGRSLEGIDMTKRQWERQLTLNNVKKAVNNRTSNAVLIAMPDAEYDELVRILTSMEHNGSPEMDAFWTYRHALEHRMPQSVDYREMYPYWRPGANPDWQFLDLFNATVQVYEHYYGLLDALAKLPISNHPASGRP